MITRFVIVHVASGVVYPTGFSTDQQAWKAQCDLARQQDGASPYDWSSYAVEFEVN
tara:strand:+ start:250 stop:417 length:168 start_codon:yes stop_codon:yes gene_type:complete